MRIRPSRVHVPAGGPPGGGAAYGPTAGRPGQLIRRSFPARGTGAPVRRGGSTRSGRRGPPRGPDRAGPAWQEVGDVTPDRRVGQGQFGGDLGVGQPCATSRNTSRSRWVKRSSAGSVVPGGLPSRWLSISRRVVEGCALRGMRPATETVRGSSLPAARLRPPSGTHLPTGCSRTDDSRAPYGKPLPLRLPHRRRPPDTSEATPPTDKTAVRRSPPQRRPSRNPA